MSEYIGLTAMVVGGILIAATTACVACGVIYITAKALWGMDWYLAKVVFRTSANGEPLRNACEYLNGYAGQLRYHGGARGARFYAIKHEQLCDFAGVDFVSPEPDTAEGGDG